MAHCLHACEQRQSARRSGRELAHWRDAIVAVRAMLKVNGLAKRIAVRAGSAAMITDIQLTGRTPRVGQTRLCHAQR